MTDHQTLVLRLAGPMQSWGVNSQFNRRETQDRPTKSGVLGLLAAAQGRRRGDDIADLLQLGLAVRVDQPGTVLRDYHTVSDYTGRPLLSAVVGRNGLQKPTSTKKMTHVTQRFYLQDAVFVAFIAGDERLVGGLAEAVQHPRYHLFLGRRNCTPTQPMIVPNDTGMLWHGDLMDLVQRVPWQAGHAGHRANRDRPSVRLAATVELTDGADQVADVPVSYGHDRRGFTTRRVEHLWIDLPTGEGQATSHDPFALLGGVQ